MAEYRVKPHRLLQPARATRGVELRRLDIVLPTERCPSRDHALRSQCMQGNVGSQSRLVELLGQKAYDYVRELAQAGMIDRRKEGATRRLTTTRRFAELFGCPETERKKVRAWFREQVKSSGMLDAIDPEHLILQELDDDIES